MLGLEVFRGLPQVVCPSLSGALLDAPPRGCRVAASACVAERLVAYPAVRRGVATANAATAIHRSSSSDTVHAELVSISGISKDSSVGILSVSLPCGVVVPMSYSSGLD